ncbi:MAG TPA: DUF2911 domain-containing protein [Verrucomicrobiae bacterium]|jgi:hypothetical protein|nr:DUF2911 domain-containing protein [Verrucomicrobiae bacterium]
MKTLRSTIALSALTLALALPVSAQQHRLSPHETFSARIGGDRVTVTYGRPYTVKPGTTEVRKIWGGLVPYGEPWRLGADEATLFITQKPLEVGGKTIPAGAYTLYMAPQETGASQLAFSSALGGWGIPVDTDHDVARVDLKKTDLDKPVDQFTMAISRNSGGGVLKISWEQEEFSVPFTVQK